MWRGLRGGHDTAAEGSLQLTRYPLTVTESPTTALTADPTETHNLTWNFNSGAEAFNFLAPGETLSLHYTIQPDDGHAPTGTGDGVVTINIAGTNDAPVITGGATIGGVKEDIGAQNQATGQLFAVDPDDGATQAWTVVGGTPSGTA